MNRKGDGKNWSGPNLGYCPSICLEGLKKTTKNLSQDNQGLVYLNQAFSEYKSHVLLFETTDSVIMNIIHCFIS
jgi:hypothetical protein